MSRNRIYALFALLLFSVAAGCAGTPELPPARSVYDPAKATARVVGSIRFEGTPPVMPPVRAGGSVFCVRNAPAGMTKEEVSVTADGKLRNVMVYVRSGHEGPSYTAPAEPVVLDQQRCVYTPHVLTLMVHQQLLVRNSDDTFHNVNGQTKSNPTFNFAQFSEGAENTLVFEHSELPTLIGCDMHRWMTSYIAVFDHPFHTTTGTTGDFELKLPQGKYEIGAWHEKYGEQTMPVDVAENGKVELNFKFSEKAAN